MNRLPPSASVATAKEGAKRHAPAAARNAAVLAALLERIAPNEGAALEIASGTGQHVIGFAAALPGLHWQPSDVAPERVASIDAYVAEAGLPNVAPARIFDACAPGWGQGAAPQDLIVVINLLHLISEAAAKCLVAEAAAALTSGGILMIYGPFRRDGALTSAGDQRFDAELRAADPAIGYKEASDVAAWLANANLSVEREEMPANNLALIARKAAP